MITDRAALPAPVTPQRLGGGGQAAPRRRPARTRHAIRLGLLLVLLPAILAGVAPGLPAGAALAQPRSFSCIGAEALEDDVFAVPFARGSDRLREETRSGLDAAAALAREAPERNLCVLGHADRGQGAGTSTQLAAKRARAVAQALSQRGVERDRIRAEARVGAFSGRQQEPGARAVTIVLMPALR